MHAIHCPLQASSYIEPWYHETIYQFALKMPFKLQLSFLYVGLHVGPDVDPEFGDEPLPRIRKSMLLSTSFCSQLLHFSFPFFFFSFSFLNHRYMYFGEGGNAEDWIFTEMLTKVFFWFHCFVIGAVCVVRRSLHSPNGTEEKKKEALKSCQLL